MRKLFAWLWAKLRGRRVWVERRKDGTVVLHGLGDEYARQGKAKRHLD